MQQNLALSLLKAFYKCGKGSRFTLADTLPPCKAAAFPVLAAREIERKIDSQVVSNSDLNPGTTIAESTVASIALHTYSPQSHSGTATTIVYKSTIDKDAQPYNTARDSSCPPWY